MTTNVHDTRCTTRCLVGVLVALVGLASTGCHSAPPSRQPIQMVKIETTPSRGSNIRPPLALHSKITGTESANDLDNSGPKVSEPPKEKAKSEARFAAPQDHVQLTKHSAVPVGGNLHGQRPDAL